MFEVGFTSGQAAGRDGVGHCQWPPHLCYDKNVEHIMTSAERILMHVERIPMIVPRALMHVECNRMNAERILMNAECT